MRPTSSGAMASEPARPTTSLFSAPPGWSGASTHSRVTAAMCGVMTPGQPPERTKMTCLATSSTGTPRNRAVQSRRATSAQTRPQSSCAPVPSVLPTRATSVSGLSFPESASFCSPDVSAGVALGQTNISTRCAFIASPQSRPGGRWNPNPGIFSSCSAKSSSSYSCAKRPTSCTPTGRPSCKPAGIETAGTRAKLTGSTNCT